MIIPAILEKDFEEIKRKVALVEDLSEIIQIDFVDGEFAKRATFLDIDRLNSLSTTSVLDIHLMVQKPLEFLARKLKNAEMVSFHAESGNAKNIIKRLKEIGYRAGISINPDTKIQTITQHINDVDYVQFLGVVPGRQGRKFDPKVVDKVKEFKNKYPEKTTQVDGGVNELNIQSLLDSGVDNIVIGSAIFNWENPRDRLLMFQKISGSIG